MDLEEPGGLPPCGLLLLVEDFDRLLFVSEVGLELYDILQNCLCRNSETLPKLRDMEHIVDGCQVRRELHSISD